MSGAPQQVRMLPMLGWRMEPCACGGPPIFSVRPNDWDWNRLMVSRHQETPQHQAWRASRT